MQVEGGEGVRRRVYNVKGEGGEGVRREGT